MNVTRRDPLTEKEIKRLVTARKAGVTWRSLVKRFGMGADALRKAFRVKVKHETS